MARTCDVCKKQYMKGNLVPRGIGRRVTRRTTVKQKPNLRNKRIEVNGKMIRVRICASCLKRLKFEQKAAVAEQKAIDENGAK